MAWLPVTIAILANEQVEDWLNAYFTHFRAIIHMGLPAWEARLWDMVTFTAKKSFAIITNWFKGCLW